MTYLVMETHPAYAVVLDEAGRFLKVANRGYQPGDRVTDVIPLRAARLTPLRFAPALTAAAGLAACLCLGYFGWYRPGYTAYGTLNIRINPEVELTHMLVDNCAMQLAAAGACWRWRAATPTATRWPTATTLPANRPRPSRWSWWTGPWRWDFCPTAMPSP